MCVLCIVTNSLVSCFIFYTFIVLWSLVLFFGSLHLLFRSFDYVAQHRTWKLYAGFFFLSKWSTQTAFFLCVLVVDRCCTSIVFYFLLRFFNGFLLNMPIICEQCPRHMNKYESNSFHADCSSTSELIHRKLQDFVKVSLSTATATIDKEKINTNQYLIQCAQTMLFDLRYVLHLLNQFRLSHSDARVKRKRNFHTSQSKTFIWFPFHLAGFFFLLRYDFFSLVVFVCVCVCAFASFIGNVNLGHYWIMLN